MKKVVALLLAVVLLVTMLPPYSVTQKVEAAGSYFLFPNEHDTAGNARIVSTPNVTLEGTINGVVGNSISYRVEQIVIDAAGERVVNNTEDITTGISAPTGENRITVSSIALFAGLNKITFKGVAGASTVSESIYLDYRNSPMLYDLKVTFENRDYMMPENEPTMLYSTAPNILERGTIVITGKAPNASKVTIVINDRSYDFNVSTASTDSRFSTSQLTVDKGINYITFKVYNGGQVVETMRELAFYNGEVTYYDMKLKDVGDASASPAIPAQSVNLINNLNFSTPSVSNGRLSIDGKAIIPLPLRDLNNTDPARRNDVLPVTAANLASLLSMNLQRGSNAAVKLTPLEADISFYPAAPTADTKFITVSFTYRLTDMQFDASNRVNYVAPNDTVFNTSGWTNFTLRDSTTAYIYDINYLSGYDTTMTAPTVNSARLSGLTGTDIPSDGVNVYSIPMAVEVLIGNYAGLGTGDSLNNLFKVNGKLQSESSNAFKQIVFSEIVYRTINGQSVPFRRMIVEISKLPTSGTNNVTFALNREDTASEEVKSILVKLLYGPHAKFNTLVDGMSVDFDTVRESAASLLTKLGHFGGQIFNVANEEEIVYAPPGQSVFLYINNVEVPLYADSSKLKYTIYDPDDTATNAIQNKQNFIFNILNKAGDNTVKFVFRSTKNNYENTLRFSIVPTNLPVIPAPGTDGVYPYSSQLTKPLPNDASFVKQGTVFTTKEARYNVFGTFDFVDLGGEGAFSGNQGQLVSGPENYIVTISSPNWSTSVKWNLGMELTPTKNGVPLAGFETTPFNRNSNNPGASNPSTTEASIQFYYDVDDQNFYFIMNGQEMPEDGSPQVYVITVFNSGEAGPRATYRMEINSTSIPYTILAPLKEEMTTNQNFVEVIISSPGADSIVINKETAELVKFKDHSNDTVENIDAFRVLVKDLRPNKDNKIAFTITRGTDTIKQEITVKYIPANIPGAQMLQTMASSHKVFNNALTLTFPKNTQLVRPDYNSQSDYARQPYSGNGILFAIANPNDGIVNRHEFKAQVPNYSANSQADGNLHIGYRFQDQARQFIKVSPLFWIDGGLADNPDVDSPAFDPVTIGQDPFPFPNIVGMHEDNFAKRHGKYQLELVPTTAGELTLSYDSNVAESAGTTITVFRFDPYNSTWENIGGVVNEKKHTVTVPFTKFGYYVAVKLTRGFNDVTDHPYAREAMEAIYAKGIMNAVDRNGVFGGDRYVTRGEFTRMIVRALNLPLNYEGDNHFTYYPETITNALNENAIYDYRYIETAARAGIVNGTRPGFFDEDVELSRQQAATIIARALNLKLETDSVKAKNALDKAFKDSGSFDFYSIPSVLAIQKKGFIQGKLVNPLDAKEGFAFDPRARLLRSDAAIIIARVMFDMKKLPKIYN